MTKPEAIELYGQPLFRLCQYKRRGGLYGQTLFRLCQYRRRGWIMKFESKARKNYKPQYTKVFEDLEFLQ